MLFSDLSLCDPFRVNVAIKYFHFYNLKDGS